MKENIPPGVAVAVVVVVLILVAVVGMKVFAPSGGPSKPSKEQEADIAQRNQASRHFMMSPQGNPNMGAPQGTSAQQQQGMQNFFKGQQGH